MTNPIELLEPEVLSLPAAERSRLLGQLLASLDTEPEFFAAWMQEAACRDAEIESGITQLAPGPEAMARLRARFPCPPFVTKP